MSSPLQFTFNDRRWFAGLVNIRTIIISFMDDGAMNAKDRLGTEIYMQEITKTEK